MGHPRSFDARDQVPDANSTDNIQTQEVTGNKADSAAAAVNNTNSIVAYVKAIFTSTVGGSQILWQQGQTGDLDEDGGRYSFDVGVVDRDTGAVASGSIDIASAVVSLEKSTAGGAFSTGGITQPTAAKANGLVTVSSDVVASEWQVGDHYKLTLTTISATNSASGTEYMPAMVWVGEIVEDSDLKTTVDDIDTDLGEPTEAATATPFSTSGTVMSRLRGIGDETDTINTAVGATSDSAVDPQGSTGSLHAKMRGVVDYTWDEVLTGATHNVSDSAGKRLRQLTSDVIRDGTAQAGTANTITLDSGASATDNIYNPGLVLIDGGTGSGQVRRIIQYTGSTKVAVVDKDWRINPDSTSTFLILTDPGGLSINEGLATGGAATTITLNSGGSAVDDTYNGQILHIRAGTGQDQARIIVDYNGTTKVATVSPAWNTTPDATSAYAILPGIGQSPTANATGDQTINETIGNKADAASSGSTASLVALTRALIEVYASATGVADSGTTTTMVDATRTEADTDYWRGMMLVFTSGPNDGQARAIVDFDPATDTLTVAPAFTQAIAAGHNYAIVSYEGMGEFHIALNATGLAITTNSIADQLYLGAGEQLRNFIAKTGGRVIASGKSLVDAIGSDGTTYADEGIAALIGIDNNNGAFASTNVVANRDGNLMERSEHVMDMLTAATADSVANTDVSDVVGNKTDAASSGIGTTTSLMAYLKAAFTSVGATTVVARATVSCPASTETDVLADQTVESGKAKDVVVQVDLTNLTQSATINVYQDGGSGGTSPTKVDPSKAWTTSDNDIIEIKFTALSDYKVTVTTGAEGANRDVYVRHMYKTINP